MKETMVVTARRTGKTTSAQLAKAIKEASMAYYTGESVLSDAEFDKMVDKLRAMSPKHKVLTMVGWGIKVHGEKIKLPAAIKKSLDKYHDVPSLKKALRSPKRANIALKIDGLSALLKYDYVGRLKSACTRGDGIYGVDITIKIPFISGGAEILRGPAGKVIRGELYIPIPVYNEHLKERYKNPRDATAGIINSKNFDNLERVSFIAHEPCLGFKGEFVKYTVGPITEELLGSFYKKCLDEGYYGIDGLVVRTKSDTSSKVAFKFPTEALEGRVRAVHWSLSDTMQLCPTVELDERFMLYGKEIGGSITAHNAAYIRDNCIGPGAIVKISRANEIIPEIVGVVKHSCSDKTGVPREWDGHEVYWDGPRLFVVNSKLEHEFRLNRFLSTYFMPDGITDSDTMRVALRIKELQDIRDLIGKPNTIEKRLRKADSGYGDVKIGKIKEMFSKKRKLDPKKFLRALCIRNIGNTVSEVAANHLFLFKDRHPHTWRSMCDRVVAHKHIVEAIKANWGYMQNSYLMFADRMGDVKQVISTKGIIVMTGKGWLPREKLKSACQDFGFTVHGSVTKNTYWLVQEDPNSKSDKSKRAKALGVKIISYETLKLIMEKGG